MRNFYVPSDLGLNLNNCRNCPLSVNRCPERYVSAELNTPSILTEDRVDILFVGEAPGKTEQAEGVPFCGDSGVLLRNFLSELFSRNTTRFSYMFSNICKCRPYDQVGNNREPSKEERNHCFPYLQEEIKKFNPKAIVLLGGTSMETFFPNIKNGILFNRGRIFKYDFMGREIPCYLTLHPAAVLRDSRLAGLFFDDLSMAIELAEGTILTFPDLGHSQIVDNMQDAEDLIDHFRHGLTRDDNLVIDVETDNLNRRYGNELISINFAFNNEIGYVLPCVHKESPWSPEEYAHIKKLLTLSFTEPVSFGNWVMHGGQYDLQIIKQKFGVTIDNRPVRCTQNMMSLIDENRLSMGKSLHAFRLKRLAMERLQFNHYPEDVIAKIQNDSLANASMEEIVYYGGMDGYVTHRLHDYIIHYANKEGYGEKMIRLNDYVLNWVMQMFAQVSFTGFPVDDKQVSYLSNSKFSPLLQSMEKIVDDLCVLDSVKKANELLNTNTSKGMKPILGFGTPWLWDIQRPQHLVKLFFDVLKLTPLKIGKSKKPAADDKFFQANIEVPEVAMLSTYRKVYKLYTSYVEAISGWLKNSPDCSDGRVRPNFGMTFTVTGRTTSEKPNTQQLPKTKKKRPLNTQIRNIFVANSFIPAEIKNSLVSGIISPNMRKVYCLGDRILAEFDYMANEVRWLGIMAADRVLAKAFLSAKGYRDAYRKNPTPELKKMAKLAGDIHRQTASILFNVPLEKVDDDMRNRAKAIVFGLIYGMSYKTVAKNIGVSEEEGKQLRNRFLNQFLDSRNWLFNQDAMTKEMGRVFSPIGRCRRLPIVFSGIEEISHEATRQGRNSPIQEVASTANCVASSFIIGFIEYCIRGKAPLGWPHEFKECVMELVDLKTCSGEWWEGHNLVHDACTISFPVDQILDYTRVSEHSANVLVAKYFGEVFDVDMILPLEIEFKFGLKLGEMLDWDFSPLELTDIQSKLKNELQGMIH